MNKKQQSAISPVLPAVRLYTIYVLSAAAYITVVLSVIHLLRHSELYVLLGAPPALLLVTGPYLLVLPMALRKKVSPFARWVYAIAATAIPLPGLAYWIRLTFLRPVEPYGGVAVLEEQYAAALFFIAIGIAAEIVEALSARKQRGGGTSGDINDSV